MPHIHPDGTKLRDPSSLFYQSEYIRRLIIGSYWLVIIAAVPLWWHITSIQRLSLPTSRVRAQAGNQLHFPVQIQLEGIQDASLPASLQRLVDDRIRRSPQAWKGLDVKVNDQNGVCVTATTWELLTHPPDANKRLDSYTVRSTEGVPLASERHLAYPVRTETLPMLADTLSALLVPPTDTHRVAPYSPRYRLAFTLLNEDAAAGRAISGWDISGAIAHSLSILHNFTIESQVQFHAPLAFSPLSLDHGYGLTPEDLTVPLLILDSNGVPSSSDAFLLPQWGGIVIYSPTEQQHNVPLPPSALNSVFSTFASQLLGLLGVPNLPPDVHMNAPVLTGWQLDALLRRRTLENVQNAQDTLKSIVKLVDQIENMPVGLDVKGDVQNSLTALDQMYASASTSLNETLHQSADALTLASRAFFNPGMLALLYFPAEHKYAVYTPLFASAMIPLAAAAAKEIAAWRRQRREAAQVVQ
ncbi:GPI transamidase component PIG-S [Mycena sanguinolenta]|uniref:GPI transamidase component PIG-S n=1 Tax=Mycena sanguinolenta TaxID=230812 RepID=A0A8H6XPS5_9AGAR|nr:GPI transamidase component PIG-S [Mycena sanguinolenta]